MVGEVVGEEPHQKRDGKDGNKRKTHLPIPKNMGILSDDLRKTFIIGGDYISLLLKISDIIFITFHTPLLLTRTDLGES
jgi:hypothetical protein